MESKIITIQTNTKKKGKLDQRSFSCQILELGKRKMYALENTKRDLGLKRFTLTEGCRVIDDGVYYPHSSDLLYSKSTASNSRRLPRFCQ